MDECFIGQIELYPYSYAPMGWALCNGAVLNVAQNQALFSLIGYKFGGNGSTTFALPDLSNATPNSNMAYYIAVYGLYPTRG